MGNNSKPGPVQTQTATSSPWAPTVPYLKDAMAQNEALYQQGAFSPDPYQGQRVAGFGDVTQRANEMMMQRAGGGAPLVDAAQGTLTGMMAGQANPALEAVKQNALASAVPAAAAMFSGSGMTNSTQAMDTVGRAAMDAVAPYEYGAFDTAQGRAMQAAGMAPGIERAGYMPAAMMGTVGGMQDAMQQAMIDSEMQKHYETEGQDAANFQNYLANLSGMGAMGGTTSTVMQGSPTQGPSFLRRGGSSLLGGLGTYGAFAANPATAPFAIAGGIGAGLMGML